MKKKLFATSILLIALIATMCLTSAFVKLSMATTPLTPVNLGSAGNFVVLAKTGISTTGTTAITGNIGVSPAAASYITGFGLIMDSSSTFSTSSLVTGQVLAADYSAPTPTIMTTAISDMETAYTTANGMTNPIATELGAGIIGGMTLAAGLYKWSSGVTIPTDLTLSGSASDVWVFQIAQTLDISSATQVRLIGGAQESNIFWVVAGQTTLGTDSVFYGTILDQVAIVMNTRAVLHGRALAQTAVTLDANSVSLAVGGVVTPPPRVITTYTLTITTMTCHGDYSGYSTMDPPVGTYTYLSGTVALVLAHPSSGFYFDCWHLDGVEIDTQSPEIYVTMNSDHNLLAIFNPFRYTPTPPTPPPTQPPPVQPPPVIPPPIIPPSPATNVTLTVLKFCFKPVTYPYGDISPDVGQYAVPVGTTLTFTAIDNAPPVKFYSWNFNGQEIFGNTITVTVTANSTLYAMFTATSPLYAISPPRPFGRGYAIPI